MASMNLSMLNYSGGVMDYSCYEFSKFEWVYYTLRCYVMTIVITFLMYKSIIICLLTLPIAIKMLRLINKALIKKRKQQLLLEFREFLYSLSICLGSGYSIENSLPHIIKDIELLYPDGCYMSEELKRMIHRISLGESIEDAFKHFSKRADISAVTHFSASIAVVVYQGGNFIEVLKDNSRTIIDQVTTEQEIEVMIAEKQFELKFLSIFPFIIIGVLNLSSPDFMSILYTTVLGRIGMTVALLWIGAGILLSKQLVDEHL